MVSNKCIEFLSHALTKLWDKGVRVLTKEEDVNEQVQIVFRKLGVNDKEMISLCLSTGKAMLQKKMTTIWNKVLNKYRKMLKQCELIVQLMFCL